VVFAELCGERAKVRDGDAEAGITGEGEAAHGGQLFGVSQGMEAVKDRVEIGHDGGIVI